MYPTAAARTEKALRERIAQKHPELHRSETRARADIQQAQQAQTARIEQQNLRYEPPARRGRRSRAAPVPFGGSVP
ncbi:hypothetical protein ACFXKH_33110 [Streptomyces caelestis]|uniref:hypothetical protein n=1 Tax=Streptomyces caelestis TaxID=36816 RepID=UPI00368F1102